MKDISDILTCGIDVTLEAIGDTLLCPMPEEEVTPDEFLELTGTLCSNKSKLLSMLVYSDICYQL